MANVQKTYLDLDGLKRYNEKIQAWTDNEIDSKIGLLDLTEAPIAEKNVSTNVITIHGIKQTNGAVEVGNTAANDIVLTPVAATGAAEDVSIADTGSYFTATDVEGALAELALASGGGVASKTVYITETAGASGDAFSKRYGVYQGSEGSSSSPVVGEKLADIDIPKDMVVESGIVVEVFFDDSDDTLHEGSISGTDVTTEIKGTTTPTAADAGLYIKLTIANASSSHLWIKATDFVDVYTSGSTVATDEIVITVDNQNMQISAAVGTTGIAASKVNYNRAAVYTQLTSVDTYDGTETYYTKSGSTFTEDDTVTAENFDTKVAAGLYVQSSAAGTETVQAALDRLDSSSPSEEISTAEIDDLFD